MSHNTPLSEASCCKLNIVSHLPNLYVEILNSNVIVLGDEAFRRWLGHEHGILMNGISVLIKETPESSLAPFAMLGHKEETAIYEWERGPSQDAESASILTFLPLKLWEINVYCLQTILLQQPE